MPSKAIQRTESILNLLRMALPIEYGRPVTVARSIVLFVVAALLEIGGVLA